MLFSSLLYNVVKGIDPLLPHKHLSHYGVAFGFGYQKRKTLVYNIRFDIFLSVFKTRFRLCGLRRDLAVANFFILNSLVMG